MLRFLNMFSAEHCRLLFYNPLFYSNLNITQHNRKKTNNDCKITKYILRSLEASLDLIYFAHEHAHVHLDSPFCTSEVVIYSLNRAFFLSYDRKQLTSPVLSWSSVSAESCHCRTSSHSLDLWSSSALYQDHRRTSPPEEFRVIVFLLQIFVFCFFLFDRICSGHFSCWGLRAMSILAFRIARVSFEFLWESQIFDSSF